ncbi:hypothetical protein EDD85DRAFT_783260 [Armillaria nabsnona]|nr:hypothetical protein EDD85DRAFT_783260 [Armillaria nabsnona]
MGNFGPGFVPTVKNTWLLVSIPTGTLVSKAPVTIEAVDEGGKIDAKRKGKQKQQPPKPSGKKYVDMKLVDIGSRSRSASSATGGKAVIRWDAFLSSLFEPDGFDVEPRDSSSKEKIYKGSSRGAFESMSKLKETNHATSNPHPTNNILALTLESAGTITAIGRGKDLGMCTVLRRNGVEHYRAAGSESSTSNENPPTILHGNGEDAEGSATYVVSGHVVKSPGPSSLEVSENIGRERRRMEGRCNKESPKTEPSMKERTPKSRYRDGQATRHQSRSRPEWVSHGTNSHLRQKLDVPAALQSSKRPSSRFGAAT